MLEQPDLKFLISVISTCVRQTSVDVAKEHEKFLCHGSHCSVVLNILMTTKFHVVGVTCIRT